MSEHLNTPLFTNRERDVLRLLIEGYTDGEIGASLGLDKRWISEIVSTMLRRHGMRNRVELAVQAVRNGWV